LRGEREDVAGLGEIARLRIGPHCGADGVRAVVGGDPGGDAFRGFDADREIGVVRGRVVAHHRRQSKLAAAFARQRQAHQAACVRDHEIDVGRLHQFGGHDQVALVLAILVVDDHDHAAGTQFFEEFRDRGEAHAPVLTDSNRST
jgi:hypothetical protein